MSTPDIVEETLDGEPVAARVDLGGEDELLVTPTRTLVYRAEGLLSDESVEEFPHDAERVSVAEGRRKAKVTLDYGLDGERTFALPSGRLESALHPVLAGVLSAAGITDPGETVKRTFRFSELTLAVTSARVVKHVGTAVWDDEYEEFHYDDVTDLAFEEGSVATSVVITTGDRQERFKAPNDDARRVSETLEAALLAHYDVGSLEEFRTAVVPDDESGSAGTNAADAANVAFGDGPDPLSADPAELADAPANGTREAPVSETPDAVRANGAAASDDGSAGAGAAGTGAAAVVESLDPTAESESTDVGSGETQSEAVGAAVGGADAPDDEVPGTATGAEASPVDAAESDAADGDVQTDADDGFEGSGFESVATLDAADVMAELVDLRAAVEAQNERLDRQRDTIEQLVAELRRGR